MLIADAGNGQSVAELTVGLALAVARCIPPLDAHIRAGRWDRTQPGLQLAGRTAGLVAYWAISRRVSAMLRAIGMRIVVHDPHIDDRDRHGVEWAETLDDLLAAHRGPSKDGPGELNVPIACAALSVMPSD